MIVKIKGVYAKKKRLASGLTAVYCYDRATGARVDGVPGSDEFTANLNRVRTAGKKADHIAERSFADLARKFRSSVGYAELAPRTREEYDRHIDRYLMPVLADFSVARVERQHMTALMSTYASTPTLARAIKRTASVMWSFAIDGLLWISAHPFMGMDKKRKRSEEGQTPLMEAEIARFRKKIPSGTHERVGFEIGLCSALRLSDVVALPVDALTGSAEAVQTGKTGSVVLLALSAEARTAVADYAAAMAKANTPLEDWLFPGGSNGRLHRRTFSRDMAAAFDKAKLTTKRFHSLRYTACIRLYEAGFGYDVIARQAGHSMAAMAKKYREKRREARGNAEVSNAFDEDGPALPSPNRPLSPPRRRRNEHNQIVSHGVV